MWRYQLDPLRNRRGYIGAAVLVLASAAAQFLEQLLERIIP